MSHIISNFLLKWHKMIEARDINQGAELFAHNVRFLSPVVHEPFTSMLKIKHILTWILEIVEGFHYTATVTNPATLQVALVFAGKHKDLQIEGVDLIQLNEEGKITELKVMLRPLKATLAIADTMKEKLQTLAPPKL